MAKVTPNYLKRITFDLVSYTIFYEYVMHSKKRDLKLANVNFEIVNYDVDECLTNIKKKVHQKVQKWLS